MNKLNRIFKNQYREYTAIILMILFMISNIQVPVFLAQLINPLLGRILVVVIAISLFNIHPVLGAVALVFAYELIIRSHKSVHQDNVNNYLPSEHKKYKHLTLMNQFPVTLEEEVVNKMVPLVDNSGPVNSDYKPVMADLHDASKIN
jgi:hypothetical protein